MSHKFAKKVVGREKVVIETTLEHKYSFKSKVVKEN